MNKSKASLLYTGNISLTINRTKKIIKLMNLSRWEQVEVLQVPHHGSAESWDWEAKLSNLFQHRYSVFSSARHHNKYFHPREEVLEDLKNTTRILVNEYTGAVFHGCACWHVAATQTSPKEP